MEKHGENFKKEIKKKTQKKPTTIEEYNWNKEYILQQIRRYKSIDEWPGLQVVEIT